MRSDFQRDRDRIVQLVVAVVALGAKGRQLSVVVRAPLEGLSGLSVIFRAPQVLVNLATLTNPQVLDYYSVSQSS